MAKKRNEPRASDRKAFDEAKARAKERQRVWVDPRFPNLRLSGNRKGEGLQPVDDGPELPSWMPIGWQSHDEFTAENSDEAWQQWLDYQIETVDLAAKYGAENYRGGTESWAAFRLIVDDALLIVEQLARSNVTREQAESRIKNLQPPVALRAIKKLLWPPQAGAEPPAKHGTDREPLATERSELGEGEIPTLPERCYLSLKTLLIGNAVSADKSMTAVQIALKAEGKAANPESFKRPLSTLKKQGYTDSKKGTDGGCWLTVKGIDVAKKL